MTSGASMNHVQEVVLREQNVRLEPEIELLGAAW